EDLFGALETYRAFEQQSPGANNTLVMGPWKHGGWSRTQGTHHGDVSFGQATSRFYQEKIELPFFQHHLKDAPAATVTEAWIFETGTNVWHRYRSWPPPGTRSSSYFFGANGTLTQQPSTSEETAFAQYLSDPNKPVPYMDTHAVRINKNYMSADQRFAARRPDVVVFATEALTQDVRLAGSVVADLWVSTSGSDADFIVKLIDVYPADYKDPSPNPRKVHMGGYQQLVRAEVIRGKYRNSFVSPAPFVPNQPTRVRLKLPAVSHAFRPGHRMMVQVQSSWFPLVDRNPQVFTNIYAASASDFRSATVRIYHDALRPSHINVTLAPSPTSAP
ncbi:MAG TPA: CocE/NonD family hydrolase, partial [Sorangium sp.]|nr:CocE/NonD family hydrolase [Sorangium sp.]